MAENPKKPNEEPSFLNPEANSEKSFSSMDFLCWFFFPLLCVYAEYAVAFTDWSGENKFLVVCALFTMAITWVKIFSPNCAKKEALAGNEARAKRILSLSKSSWRWILFSPVLARLCELVFSYDEPFGYSLVWFFHAFFGLGVLCWKVAKSIEECPPPVYHVKLDDVDRELFENKRKK